MHRMLMLGRIPECAQNRLMHATDHKLQMHVGSEQVIHRATC